MEGVKESKVKEIKKVKRNLVEIKKATIQNKK